MDSEQFDLVFSGELVRGADLQQSKLNLGRLFKIPEDKVDALFSGKPIVLKKSLDFATANKYRVAIKKAGCRVDLVEKAASQNNTADVSEPRPVEQAEPAAQAPESAAASFQAPSIQEPSIAKPDPQNEPSLPLPEVQEDSEQSSFDLAPVGSDVLSADEKHDFIPANIDTSNLNIKEVGSSMLEESEREQKQPEHVAGLHADLAPVGSDLLDENEKSHEEELELDLSALSLSEPGVELGEIHEEKEIRVPDTSHLSLD